MVRMPFHLASMILISSRNWLLPHEGMLHLEIAHGQPTITVRSNTKTHTG